MKKTDYSGSPWVLSNRHMCVFIQQEAAGSGALKTEKERKPKRFLSFV